MFAKKRFSQNFLVNDEIATRIVNELDISDYDIVVEIGPGKGVLTNIILQKTKNAYFIELDMSMCELLEERFNLGDRLINADVLKLDLEKVFNGKKIKIIGNFPYNISGKLIFKFYENKNIIKKVVGMFQKEVVDRLIARPCCKNYGIPSIFTQCYFDIKKLFDVGPSNFFPTPKVTSSVFSLNRNDISNLGCNENLFKKIVKLSFSSRRKIIKNNFRCNDYYKFIPSNYLELRAEMLSISDFVNITNKIDKIGEI